MRLVRRSRFTADRTGGGWDISPTNRAIIARALRPPRRSRGAGGARGACRRPRPRGGSALRSGGPRAGSRASSPAGRGGRSGRSSGYPSPHEADDLLRGLVGRVDHELVAFHVPEDDPVDRLVAHPLGRLPCRPWPPPPPRRVPLATREARRSTP